MCALWREVTGSWLWVVFWGGPRQSCRSGSVPPQASPVSPAVWAAVLRGIRRARSRGACAPSLKPVNIASELVFISLKHAFRVTRCLPSAGRKKELKEHPLLLNDDQKIQLAIKNKKSTFKKRCSVAYKAKSSSVKSLQYL